jgi:hypothetical protein
MLRFNISYPDLIKFPYFADSTERGDRGAKANEIGVKQRMTLLITLVYNHDSQKNEKVKKSVRELLFLKGI